MGKYFGTDGFRGEANVKLTVEHAFQVGRFLGWYFGRDHKAKIVIGKDTRRSSYMFEYALAAGLTASGADAYLMHVTTTPSVSYITRTERFDCGVMISASHNPFYDNGIKLIGGGGTKIDAAIEEKIEHYIDSNEPEIPLAVRENIGRTVDFSAGRNRYIGHLISIPTRSFKNIRVGLDCANGSTSSIAKNVFDAVGANTYVINNAPDGTNINRDCGSTHIEALQRFVTDNGLDVGFAYDGDGDRCLAVDENGALVDGDRIMFVCAKYMKEQGVNRIGFAGEYMHCRSFFERYMAFRCGLELLGIPYHREWCITGKPDTRYASEEGNPAENYYFHAIADMPSLPRAFICANDFVALDIMRALRRHSVKVPDDVYLLGFDDSPESRLVTPKLSTVHIHSQILGFTAAELILSRIRNPDLNFRTCSCETSLILRESTADTAGKKGKLA